MFKTELSCEEESLLLQLLDGKKLTRKELLLEINYCSQNTEAERKKQAQENKARGLYSEQDLE